MRKIVLLTALSVFYFSLFLGLMIADVGEVSEASTYTVWLPITYSIIFITIFTLGFSLSKSISDYNKN
jgi:hypothetical protein